MSVEGGRDMMSSKEDGMRPAPDLTVMDDDDQHREVYAWAGLALYYAQVLEQGMIHAAYVAQIDDKTLVKGFTSAEEFQEVVDRQTAGKIIRRVREHVALSPELEAICLACVDRRNFLTHHFFSERSDLFARLEDRQLMLEELREMIVGFQTADAGLERAMFEHGEAINFTPTLVRRIYETRKAELESGSARAPEEVMLEVLRRERPEWPSVRAAQTETDDDS
ncbi:MAG: hypothetical protein ACRDVP_02595 [Acidimicrobiales bacterium]